MYIKISEFARRCGVCIQTVHNNLEELDYFHGKYIMIDERNVEKFKSAHKPKPRGTKEEEKRIVTPYNDTILFAKVKPGGMFTYSGKHYMRLRSCDTTNTTIEREAVELETGYVHIFAPTVQVTPIKGATISGA